MRTEVQEPLHTSDFVKTDQRSSADVIRQEENIKNENIVRQDQQVTPAPVNEGPTALFVNDEARDLRSRWEKIQIEFVDEPRKSVEEADELVATVIKRLAEIFAGERTKLEHAWEGGDNVSTEDLRIALRQYRSFFDRLLSM